MRIIKFLVFSALLLALGGLPLVILRGRTRVLLSHAIWLVLRGGTLVMATRWLRLSAEGQEYIPRSGPVLIAARHFHFLYDGTVLIRAVPRRLHTIVALDWLQIQILRPLIELGCELADWPVVLRGTAMKIRPVHRRWVYQPVEGRRYLRRVMQDVARLLRAGEVVVIFPEGYPNVDPHPTPKQDLEAFLPFQPGFVKMVERAERDNRTRVAIVPAGLVYTRISGRSWRARVRFGPALFREDFASSAEILRALEEQVRELSCAPLASIVSDRPDEIHLV